MLFQSNNRYQHISQSEERHEHSREAGDIGKRLFSVSHSSFLCLLLFASIVTNVAFFAKKLPKGLDTCNCVSTYAGIDGYNYPQALLENRTYVDQDDLTTTMQAWEALSGDPGVVALSDEFVADKGLPVAMRYPWDESKGVYLLQGFHNLHCIRTIFRSLMDYHHNRPQRIALVHILHCLDELRRDVICHADDTPRYAGMQDPPGTGKGQIKMCKSWEALESWALKNTACFQHEDEVADRMINRFKHCADGSQPWLGLQSVEADPMD